VGASHPTFVKSKKRKFSFKTMLIPPVVGKPIFFSGWHQPVRGRSGCGEFRYTLIGINRLINRESDFWCQKVLIDSSAFTRISGLYKGFKGHLSTRKYASLVRKWKAILGERLIAVVAQDYMCELLVLNNTGLTVADHQRITILRYDNLCRLLQDTKIHVIPVLQGYAPEEYVSHIYQYGERLKPGAWVGVGSVCKRNSNPEAIYDVLTAIKSVRPDLRLHGFGLKKESLEYLEIQNLLYSADSAAAGLQHGNGTNKYVRSNDPKRALEYEAEIYASFRQPKRLPAKQLCLF
jgi:hypothetical protein